MTSINFNLEDPTHKKRQLRTWFLCLGWCSFFEFWLGGKQLFHIPPFHICSYVLMSLVCLEVSNGVSNWNKGKNLIFVWSLLQICQLEIPIFICKFISLNSLWNSVSYGFCVFNCVASWNKGKTLILVLSFQICHQVILVSHSN